MNPILTAVLGPIFDLLKQVIPDSNARAQAQEEITKLLVANEAAMLDAMKSTMAADAASEGWLTRNARPIVVMWSLGMVTAIFVEGLTGGTTNAITALRQVPQELWNLITVGIGAYILGKSGEGIARSIANRPNGTNGSGGR